MVLTTIVRQMCAWNKQKHRVIWLILLDLVKYISEKLVSWYIRSSKSIGTSLVFEQCNQKMNMKRVAAFMASYLHLDVLCSLEHGASDPSFGAQKYWNSIGVKIHERDLVFITVETILNFWKSFSWKFFFLHSGHKMSI